MVVGDICGSKRCLQAIDESAEGRYTCQDNWKMEGPLSAVAVVTTVAAMAAERKPEGKL